MNDQNRDFSKTRFTKRVAVTEADYLWIKQSRGRKSQAGFLEVIIGYVKNFKKLAHLVNDTNQQNLFKNAKPRANFGHMDNKHGQKGL